MLRLLDRLGFLFGEPFVSLRRNGWMTFSAITTVSVALYLLGILSFSYLKIFQYSESLPNKLEINVFLKDDALRDQAKLVWDVIQSIPKVNKVVWIPKEMAWEQQKKEMPDLVQGIENPLPDAFKVTLKDLNGVEKIANHIKGLEGVDPNGVIYFDEEHEMLSQAMWLIKQLGLILSGILLFTGGLLIYNAVRFTILSRLREFKIMQLVGATGTTIVLPLILEGMIQGLFGGILAGGFMTGTYFGLIELLENYPSFNIKFEFPTFKVLAVLGVAGICFGFICSFLATRRIHRRLERI